jgi:hypothetical protein
LLPSSFGFDGGEVGGNRARRVHLPGVFQVVGLLAHYKAVFLGLLALAVTAIMVLFYT